GGEGERLYDAVAAGRGRAAADCARRRRDGGARGGATWGPARARRGRQPRRRGAPRRDAARHRRDAGGLRRAVGARAARGVPARRGSPRHRPAPHGRLRPGAADPRDRAGDAPDRGVGVWPRSRPVAVGGSGIRGSLREARRHRRAARGGARGRVTAGYALIVLAACFWGGSTSFGKHLLEAGVSTTAL